jgi:Big-like domain-containing protein
MSSSRRKLQLVASFTLLLLIAVGGVGCNGFFVDPVLTSIQVGPSGLQILVGKTLQMSALGTYDQSNGGQPKDITGKSFWGSDSQNVATVSATGLVTGVGNGTATITASSGAVSGTATVSVTVAVSSITVTPSSQSVSIAQGIPFCLQATAGPSGDDISSTATWNFTNNGIAVTTITKTTATGCTSAQGQAFALGTTPAGTVTATASAPGSSGTVTSNQVTVTINP